MLELTHPAYLGLLMVAALALWFGQRRSLAEMTPRQRRVCLAVRGALLACLVLALAGVRWRRPAGDSVGVLFVVDGSASVSPEARAQARAFVEKSVEARRPGDSVGVLGFARRTAVWQPSTDEGRPAAAALAPWPEFPTAERAGTDLGRALDFAAATLPTGHPARRVVLLTDGNDTAGAAREAAGRLVAAGGELWTVPLRNPARPEALVAALETPRSLAPGEPFDARAFIESNVEIRTRVNLYADRFLVDGRDAVPLKPGRNEIVFPNVRAPTSGSSASYEVEILPEADTVVENNRAGAAAAVAGPPRVLLVDGDERAAAPLVGALRAEGLDVDLRGPAGLPTSLEELQRFDLFVLSDTPAIGLPRETMELYRRWVSDFGGGFALLGGENSFGVGGYFRTPVETMLPVRLEHDDRQETPTVALYVVLDRSGSMAATVGGQTKISLADQGAVLAMNVLGPRDLFGLTAVDTVVHPVVPLGRISEMAKSQAEEKILAINSSGGGIYVLTSLIDAFRVLRESNAKIKHCLLFSDSADAEEKIAGEMPDGVQTGGSALDVAAAMRAEKITTSVVALGGERDKDVTFLRALAEAGAGRFYLTDDARNLPQIFSTETMKVAQSSLVEEPFNARPAGPSPITAGVDWAGAPLLLGFNATKAKPTAEVALTTETGEPLLATWRYGLGQTAAWTSDAKARWAAEWLAWPGYGKFWTQFVRGLLRRDARGGFQVRAEAVGEDRLRLELDAVTPAGLFRDRLPIVVAALDPATGESRAFPAEQTGPGHYRVDVPLPAAAAGGSDAPADDNNHAEPGGLMLAVSSPDLPGERPYVFPYARPYPKEFLRADADEPLLRELAEGGGGGNNGRFAPAPAEVFARASAGGPSRPMPPAYGRATDATDGFLIAALLLLPLDIFLRRRTWRTATPTAGLEVPTIPVQPPSQTASVR